MVDLLCDEVMRLSHLLFLCAAHDLQHGSLVEEAAGGTNEPTTMFMLGAVTAKRAMVNGYS